MGWLDKLFGNRQAYSAKKVDWLDVESRWQGIKALSTSTQQADVKQCLIQADMLIDSIMKQGGAAGTGFGERLKSLKEAMPRQSYQKLWQAHLKRNELVHEPGSFVQDWEKQTHLHAYREGFETLRGMR